MKKEIRVIDGQGRVTLGKDWAGKVVVLEVWDNHAQIVKQVIKDAESDEIKRRMGRMRDVDAHSLIDQGILDAATDQIEEDFLEF